MNSIIKLVLAVLLCFATLGESKVATLLCLVWFNALFLCSIVFVPLAIWAAKYIDGLAVADRFDEESYNNILGTKIPEDKALPHIYSLATIIVLAGYGWKYSCIIYFLTCSLMIVLANVLRSYQAKWKNEGKNQSA